MSNRKDKCASCNHPRYRHRTEYDEGKRICINMTCSCPDFKEPKTAHELIRESAEAGLKAGSRVLFVPPGIDPVEVKKIYDDRVAAKISVNEARRRLGVADTITMTVGDETSVFPEVSIIPACGRCEHPNSLHFKDTNNGDSPCHEYMCRCWDYLTPDAENHTVGYYMNAAYDRELQLIDVSSAYPKEVTMQTEEFNRLVQEQIKRSTDLLIKKAGEYATDTDRMHNFKVASQLQGGTPAQALGGFLAKHVVSVFDMIGSGKDYDEEVWNEKITDSINYLLILRALVEDQS